jgi:hypothetical protein
MRCEATGREAVKWILIMAVTTSYFGGKGPTTELKSVPGFESHDACKAAGEKMAKEMAWSYPLPQNGGWGPSWMPGGEPAMSITAKPICTPDT